MFQQASHQLHQTQQNLIAEKHTAKHMKEKMQELDEEYCELEEKSKEAKKKKRYQNTVLSLIS